MRLGYNTNGLAHHRLIDAIDLIAEEDCRSVAITLDAGALDPYDDPDHLDRQLAEVRSRLDRHGLRCVIETGARYLLNPRRKHDPTLLDPDPGRRDIRIDFLSRAIAIARRLDAEAVSLWSGALPEAIPEEAAYERLASALGPVLACAERWQMRLAFEPEPGMFIDTMARFLRLDEQVAHPLFDLTIDVGHVHCNEQEPPEAVLAGWGPRIANVHIEDMVRGVHEHLMFGEGTLDVPRYLGILQAEGYAGGLHVELSRHSPTGADAARQSLAFLRRCLAAL